MPELEWKLKVDEDGHVLVEDGKPIWIDGDGKDVAYDVPSMYQKIIDLGKESKTHRETNATLQESMKLFEGIEDVPAWHKEATKALETVKNFNEKDWLKADKVDKLKADMKIAYDDQVRQIKDSFTEKESSHVQIVTKKDAQIRTLLVSSKFATCPLFSGPKPKTNLKDPKIAEAFFGKHFKVEENEKTGELITRAYHSNGDIVYSKVNPGEPAEFDEAMEAIFDAYPGKEAWMPSSGGGSGAGDGTGDTGEQTGDIAVLQKKYGEAMEKKDTKTAIALKNQIFQLQQAKKGR